METLMKLWNSGFMFGDDYNNKESWKLKHIPMSHLVHKSC